MTKTIKELIEQLKKLDENEKVICKVYTVNDIAEEVEGYMERNELLDDLTDDQLLDEFDKHYEECDEVAIKKACISMAEHLEATM